MLTFINLNFMHKKQKIPKSGVTLHGQAWFCTTISILYGMDQVSFFGFEREKNAHFDSGVVVWIPFATWIGFGGISKENIVVIEKIYGFIPWVYCEFSIESSY